MIDDLVRLVAPCAGEVEELLRALEHRAAFGSVGGGDAAPAAKLEQTFVTQIAQCAEHGVRVDAEGSGEILGRW